ncbi:MAG: hypothetical protein AB7H80_13675 [Candidatus Kapaibacterium sp.]
MKIRTVAMLLSFSMFAAAFTVTGCGSSAGDAMAVMKEYVETLESIKTVDDANAKKGKLQELGKKLSEMNGTEAEAQKLAEDPAFKELTQKMMNEMMRLGADPEIGPIITDAMQSMSN